MPKMAVAYRYKEDELKNKNVNVDEQKREKQKPQSVGNLLANYQSPKQSSEQLSQSEHTDKRDYIAQILVSELDDPEGYGCYRTIAEAIPQQIIFETLGVTKELAREGKIRKTKAAVFVDKIKRYAKARNVDLSFKTNPKEAS